MSRSHFSTLAEIQLLESRNRQPTAIASQMYNQACRRPWLHEIRSLLTGHSHCLLDLDTVRNGCKIRNSYHAGIQMVPIRQIRGSEERCGDFDADFRPLNPHNRWRWLNVAAVQQKGTMLPPVDLIQVGDSYFVQDGHHRVSVAKASGQEKIEARVTVWEVESSPLWERPASVGELTAQPA